MQNRLLLIEISEEDYKEVFKIADWKNFPKIYMNFNDHLCYAIANGIPLPEHHGRLIDVNELLDDIRLEDNDENRDCNNGEIITLENIDRISTIIPATKKKSCATCGQPKNHKGDCILYMEGKCVEKYEKWKPATKEGDGIIPIEKNKPHTVSEVICVKCGKRWIAVRPSDVLLKELECPNCGQGYVVETGQELKEDDFATKEGE